MEDFAIEDLAAAILSGTLIYSIVSAVLFLIFRATRNLNPALTPELLVNVWLMAGAILAIGDVVILLSYILDIFFDL